MQDPVTIETSMVMHFVHTPPEAAPEYQPKTPFNEGKVKPNHVGQQLKVLTKPEYLVVFFPLAFVLFPIIITFISAVTAALEQGEFTKEFTGVYLMVSRFVPYYLYLPTMIAWYASIARPVPTSTNLTQFAWLGMDHTRSHAHRT